MHAPESPSAVVPPRYVALDRDGTIIAHVHHLVDSTKVSLIPGSGEAIATLNRLQIPVFVITNQSVVGRGLVSEEGLAGIHAHMMGLLAREGAHVDALRYCPHLPDAGCLCRKPQPGMLVDLLDSMGSIPPNEGVVIGDTACDVAMGLTLHARVIHVSTGVEKSGNWPRSVERSASLLDAVNLILGTRRGRDGRP